MDAPKDFTDNLENGIITEKMYFECLYSLEKRIKNGKQKIKKNSTNFSNRYRKSNEDYAQLQSILWSIFDSREKLLEMRDNYKEYYKTRPYGGLTDLVSVPFVRKIVELIKNKNKNKKYTLWTEMTISEEDT